MQHDGQAAMEIMVTNEKNEIDKKKARLLARFHNSTACIRLVTQSFIGPGCKGPPDCENRLQVGPTGQGWRRLGNVLPALERNLRGKAQPAI